MVTENPKSSRPQCREAEKHVIHAQLGLGENPQHQRQQDHSGREAQEVEAPRPNHCGFHQPGNDPARLIKVPTDFAKWHVPRKMVQRRGWGQAEGGDGEAIPIPGWFGLTKNFIAVRNGMHQPIEGQLNDTERRILTEAILRAPKKPQVVIEVGTWLGGGSTLHILRALEENGVGHLWGIEADRSIYERMLANIKAAVPEASARFTPLFGFSQNVIPEWLAGQSPDLWWILPFLMAATGPVNRWWSLSCLLRAFLWAGNCWRTTLNCAKANGWFRTWHSWTTGKARSKMSASKACWSRRRLPPGPALKACEEHDPLCFACAAVR